MVWLDGTAPIAGIGSISCPHPPSVFQLTFEPKTNHCVGSRLCTTLAFFLRTLLQYISFNWSFHIFSISLFILTNCTSESLLPICNLYLESTSRIIKMFSSSTAYFPDKTSSAQRKKLWNPSQTLGIINTDPGYQCITCIGYAPSKRRRCRNPIRSDNVSFITNTLNEIAYLHPDSPEVTSRLRAISGRALCVRYHQGQAESIMMQWQSSIQQLKLKPQVGEQKPSNPVQSGERDEQKQALHELQEQLRQMREFLAQLQEERNSPRQSQGSARSNEQGAEKRREAERKRQEQEKEKEAREKEKERLEKERLDKERLEEERKQKEKEESKRREQAAYNERIRQRAQRVREEREREKREAERREEEEWTQAWTKYQQRWTHLRAATSIEGTLRDAIPWPVKSGLYRDVKASNVQEFFKRAVARDGNPAKLRRTECKKWHPDMMNRFLRGVQIGDADRMMIEMICRVATDLPQT
jgi:hypothetical protein